MSSSTNAVSTTLSNPEISRYGRQLMLDGFGLPGQEKIKNSKVLIVGMGGLGCPSSQYLTAAGVGTIGLVDDDTVDVTNLHRQVLHKEDKVNISKVDSAISQLSALNRNVIFVPHKVELNSTNALDIVKQYDLVLDCTDNAATRYLINDCCVLAGKVLVSGAALRFEGQVSTYNYKTGPCYRCINPHPPDPDLTQNCAEAGVLGPVTGVVGSLQAAEALKILASGESAYSGLLLVVGPWDGVLKTVQLRPRQKTCVVCGEDSTITSPADYVTFCGAGKEKEYGVVSEETERISCKALHSITGHKTLIDVRPSVEFGICAIRDSVNLPFLEMLRMKKDQLDRYIPPSAPQQPVYLVCRAGNNSQLAVQLLKGKYPDHEFRDVIGGILGWTKSVDPDFPIY